MRRVPSWQRIAVSTPRCSHRPRISRPIPRRAYSSAPRSRKTNPCVITCGLASLKRRKRQYRTRYHGVYARWRITQRSEATVRKRAVRDSRRRSITPAEESVVLGQQLARRCEDLDGPVEFARTAVAPPGAETADRVGARAVDVV